MKRYLLLFILMLTSLFSYSQNKDWQFFWDEKDELMGIKDDQSNVIVEPSYQGWFMRGGKFSDIAAVSEMKSDTLIDYYLLKNGKQFGHDSMYVFDMAYDCEREGFIRFQPRRSGNENTGLFNREGKIGIPADYSFLSEVNNGLLTALKGAEKVHFGEHWSWDGGTEYLIDTANNILVENFEFDRLINFHSMKIQDSVSTDSIRKNFLGVNGKYYTFVDNEKDFRRWLFNNLMNDLSESNLKNNSFEQISWQGGSCLGIGNSNELIHANYDLIKERLSEILKNDCEYFIALALEDHIKLDLENQFPEYFDNCGDFKYSQYPQFNIVITHYIGGAFSHQDIFNFLKSGNGYKLLSVCIR